MEIFRTEGAISYPQFKFPYTNWMHLAPSDDTGAAYSQGYLPFSGDPEDPRHLFYMARSLRIDLEKFSLDKKRRYDHRQWKEFSLKRTLMEKKVFLEAYGDVFGDLAAKWMKPRFGETALPMTRLAYITGKPYLQDILTWTHDGQLNAFALIARGNWGAHYWYVFYENGTANHSAPGHGYLVDFLDWSSSEGLAHAYIGTAYGLKSRYKSRGISGVEFWDGNNWNPDKKNLQSRQENDSQQEKSTT